MNQELSKVKELNKEYILIETVYKINYLTVAIIIVNLIEEVKNNNNLIGKVKNNNNL